MERFKELRQYQIDAIEYAQKYLKRRNIKNQCLIKMPTGTGKSVIISVLGQFATEGTCLIVVPSIALKVQIKEAISIKTWVNLGYDVNLPKEIIEIHSDNLDKVVNNPNSKVLIVTIQTLVSLKIKRPESFEKLKEQVSFVMFDEGHREPALEWSEAIRQLSNKVILFTATPARNDKKLFNYGNNIYQLSYQEAADLKVIREIEFKNITARNSELIDEIQLVLDEYTNNYSLEINDFQMIIRCETKEQIIELTTSLNANGIASAGIHDSFNNKENLYKEYVSIKDNGNIKCFIHQYKLVEGIDNSRFSILFFYSSFKNDRSIIQQVGRIIRKYSFNDNRKAWVISYTNKERTTWQNYLEFERNLTNDVAFNYSKYHKKLLNSFPNVIYNKKFLSRYKEQYSESVLIRYQIPKMANIFQVLDDTSNEIQQFEIINKLINLLMNNEYVAVLDKYVSHERREMAIIYSAYSLSKYLVNEIYVEPKLEIIAVKVINDKLFYFNSNDQKPEFLSDYWRRIDGALLIKLFNDSTEFKMATVKNGSVATNNFNRMTVNAEDISRMVSSPADKFNFLTIAKGKVELDNGKKSSRYIGFNNGRISESSDIITLERYFSWLNEINNLFNESNSHAMFNRYAPITIAPEKTDPISITLYFENAELLTDFDGNKIELNSNTFKVEFNNFILSTEDNDFEINITYCPKKREYMLTNNSDGEIPILYDSKDFIAQINKSQKFLVMLSQNKYRFYEGQFYTLGVPVDYNLINPLLDYNEMIIPKGLKVKEKGEYYERFIDAPKKDIWDDYSLFNIVSTQGKRISNASEIKRILSGAEYILCTDLFKEIADFIAISDSNNEVSFIHCKAGDSNLSASAFQEVCGQINKNLDYVHNASIREPRDLDDWDLTKRYWEIKNYGVTIDRRVVNKDGRSAREIWELLKEIQLRPESINNVIAFVGTSFSKKYYDKEITKSFEAQAAEKIQIDYILLETALAVERVNARFIVSYIE